MRYYARSLAFLSINNKDYTEKILEFIGKGINDKLYKDFRTYFIIFYNQLKVNDSLKNYRINSGMYKILNAMN